MSVKMLAFSDSFRKSSINSKLLQHAVARPRKAGASVTAIRLADSGTPIYDGDQPVEHGVPSGARAFQGSGVVD
jgi:chromate reductase, NAD(P)H dehydrogenase (quinone)